MTAAATELFPHDVPVLRTSLVRHGLVDLSTSPRARKAPAGVSTWATHQRQIYSQHRKAGEPAETSTFRDNGYVRNSFSSAEPLCQPPLCASRNAKLGAARGTVCIEIQVGLHTALRI